MYVFVVSFLMYVLLVWSGGTIPAVEIGIGLFVAIVAALLFRTWKPDRHWHLRGLNPIRWFWFLYYIFGPFAKGLLTANIDVAKRVITGEIRPGIVKVNPGLTNDLSKTLLADSITLTPGTLTVDIDDDGNYYVHWIYVTDENPTGEDIYGPFGLWARRLAE
ncbi:MAG TPA: cation transporter [Synergistaceae bacterium]|nr:cation transporter [Synergistaceae bacterium]